MSDGCYLHAASALRSNTISLHAFFECCLCHIGPAGTRVQHPEDSDSVESFLSLLFWKGPYGLVACAIKLCEAAFANKPSVSVPGGDLLPLFLACVDPACDLALIRSRDTHNMLAHPLIRQALIVTTIVCGNQALACDLVRAEPTTAAPNSEQCLFTMPHSPLVNSEDISLGLWATLVASGWAKPSSKLALMAAVSPSAEDGLALLNALEDAGYDLASQPFDKEMLLMISQGAGQPAVLQKLWDVHSVEPGHDMLLTVLEYHHPHSVEMITWLIDHYGLDANYVRPRVGREALGAGDPRDRAEMDYAHGMTVPQQTALHTAAFQGHAEAVRILLDHGARRDAVDAQGQTPLSLAQRQGHKAVIALLQS